MRDRITYRLIWLLALLANILLVFTVFSQLSDSHLEFFFNSDALYLPSLYRDLIVNGGGLNGWHVPPSVLLVPDVIMYFIIRAVAGNFIVAGFVYGLVQYVIILVLFTMIYREFAPSADFLFPALMMVFMSLFLMVSLFSGDFLFTYYLFLNGFHAGAFVMALISLWLGLKYLSRPSKNIQFILFAIIAVSLASDLLFLFMFSIPYGAVLLYHLLARHQVRSGKTLIMLGLASMAGLIIYWAIRQSGYVRLANPGNVLNLETVLNSFQIFGKQFWMYLSAADFRSVIIVLAILSIILQLVVLLWQISRGRDRGVAFSYLLFSVVFIPVVILAPLLTGSYSGYDTLRYNVYALYLAVANLAFLPGFFSFQLKIGKIVKPVLLTGLILLFISGIGNYSQKGLAHYFGYYPPFARLADQVAEKHHLKKGIANFWQAKSITMFSKQDLKIYPVFDNLKPYHHLIDRDKYYKKDAVFNFVVLNGITDTTVFWNTFGQNQQVIDTSFLKIRKVPEFRYDRNIRKPQIVED